MSEPDHESEPISRSDRDYPGRLSENFRGRNKHTINRINDSDKDIEIIRNLRGTEDHNKEENSPQFPRSKSKQEDNNIIFNLGGHNNNEKRGSVEDEVLQQFTFKDQKSAAAAFGQSVYERVRSGESYNAFHEEGGYERSGSGFNGGGLSHLIKNGSNIALDTSKVKRVNFDASANLRKQKEFISKGSKLVIRTIREMSEFP